MAERSTETQGGLEAQAPTISALLERLAERFGAGADTRIAFAEPISHGGAVVIPVARVRYGVGGGGGQGRRARGEHAPEAGAGEQVPEPSRTPEQGYGFGGGVRASPVGYIEMREGKAEFHAIRDPAADASRFVAQGLAAGLGAWMALRGLRGIIRALRR